MNDQNRHLVPRPAAPSTLRKGKRKTGGSARLEPADHVGYTLVRRFKCTIHAPLWLLIASPAFGLFVDIACILALPSTLDFLWKAWTVPSSSLWIALLSLYQLLALLFMGSAPPFFFGMAVHDLFFRKLGSVEIYEERLVIRNRRGKISYNYLWHEFDECYTLPIREELGAPYGITLIAHDGAKIVLDTRFKPTQEMINVLSRYVRLEVLEQALDTLRDGHTVEFGVIRVSQQALQVYQSVFDWSEIRQCRAWRSGLQLEVLSAAGHHQTFKFRFTQIPNASVLITLIERIKSNGNAYR